MAKAKAKVKTSDGFDIETFLAQLKSLSSFDRQIVLWILRQMMMRDRLGKLEKEVELLKGKLAKLEA